MLPACHSSRPCIGLDGASTPCPSACALTISVATEKETEIICSHHDSHPTTVQADGWPVQGTLGESTRMDAFRWRQGRTEGAADVFARFRDHMAARGCAA